MRSKCLWGAKLFLFCTLMMYTVALLMLPAEAFASEPVIAEEKVFSVNFVEEYPEIGRDLHVSVNGLEENETCTYTWKVEGKDAIVGQKEVYKPTMADLEKFITVTIETSKGRKLEHSVYFSKLPVVYIDTNDVPIVDKENYVDGYMNIQGNEKFNSKNTTLYDGELEIRGRGNSSWDAPKKPYRLKLGTKADIFGMGANKHWTLLANYFDPSLSRNQLSYDFSGELGLVSMDSENVILIMNGAYQGVYQLCEHIRIDKTRIDITDWEKIAEDTAEIISESDKDIDAGALEDYLVENMSWITSKEVVFEDKVYNLKDYEVELPGIEGGYLLELDKNLDEVSNFYSSKNQPLMFKSPEYVNTNNEMMQYVKNYVDAFESAISAQDGCTVYQGKDVHYSELYDMDALVKYFLVTELFFNTDGMKKSTYLYKDHDELMKMGPIWDMDWCAGSPFEQSSPWDRWQTVFYDDQDQWYKYLVGDPYFAYKVKTLYDEYRASIESFVVDGGRIDQNLAYLKEAGIKNDTKWKAEYGEFLQNTENLKAWMKKRISWLDNQMKSTEDLLKSWGVFDQNQKNAQVLKIESVTMSDNGILINISSSASQEIAVYMNGIQYGQKESENGKAEFLIPYELFKDMEQKEVFVEVHTSYQNQEYIDFQSAKMKLPEETENVPLDLKFLSYCNENELAVWDQRIAKMDEQQAATMKAYIDNDIIKGASSDYEKAKLIYEWISENVTYASDISQQAYLEPYDVFTYKTAVCGGYSNLYKAMLNLVNIPSVLISGDTPYGAHVWNAVYVDGRWFYSDATWRETYFDKGADAFLQDHRSQRIENVSVSADGNVLVGYDDSMGYGTGLAVVGVKNGVTTVDIPDKFKDFAITSISHQLFNSLYGVKVVNVGQYITEITEVHSKTLEAINVAENNSMYASKDGVLFSKDMSRIWIYPLAKKDSSFTLPKETTIIDLKETFDNEYLVNLEVEEGNPEYSSYKGALYNVDKTELLTVPRGKTKVYVPENAKIGEMAFANADIGKVTICAKEGTPAHQYAINHNIAFMSEDVTKVFGDVKKEEWYVSCVQYVYDNGIMNGSNGMFKPTANITRQQVVSTLYSMEGEPEVIDYTAVSELKDLNNGEWYTKAVCWGYNTGVATGNSATKMFGIGNDITRQQLAMMLMNYAEYKGYDIDTRGTYPSDLKGVDEVADYAAEAMQWAYGTGLISGSKTEVNSVIVYDLNPTGAASRAQMASILQNFVKNNL